ncbi:MAG: TorF family putative porin [Planctomycetota bacterium]
MDFYFRRSDNEETFGGNGCIAECRRLCQRGRDSRSFVNAEETAEAGPIIEGVTTTVDVTYTSKYMWRGFNVYGSHGAIQPSVDFALENGFSANVWMSMPVGSGENDAGGSINDQLTEFDYTLAYSNSILEDALQTNYSVGWRYYDFTKTSTKDNDMQEVFVEFAMPNLVGNGFTPRGAWYQMWNSKSGGANSGAGGSIFAMGFGYDFTLEQAPELPMNFSWDIVYNGGTGAQTVAPKYQGSGVDHDWSHMVFGLSTAIDCPVTSGKIVPAVYWQNSFEDTVNNSDELWAGISFTMEF